MSAAAPPLWIGQRVEISKLGMGNVMYLGEPQFAPGLWVGIVLDLPNGKNDGSVQGQVYIDDCPPRHGVFVRPSQVHPLSQSDSDLATAPDDDLSGDLSPAPSDTFDSAVRNSGNRATPAAATSHVPGARTGRGINRSPTTAPRAPLSNAARTRAAASSAPSAATQSPSPAKLRAPIPSRASLTPGSARDTPPRGSPVRRESIVPTSAAGRLRTPATTGASSRPSPSPGGSRAPSAPNKQTPSARLTPSRPTPTARPGVRQGVRPSSSVHTGSASNTSSHAPKPPTSSPIRRPGAAAANSISRRPTASTTTPSRGNSTLASSRGARTTITPAANRAANQPFDAGDLPVQRDPGSDPPGEGSDDLDPAQAVANSSKLEFDGLGPNQMQSELVSQNASESLGADESMRDFGGHSLLTSSSRGTATASPIKQVSQAPSREVSDLRKKVTVLERQRDDDRDRLRELERYKEDAEKFLLQKDKMTERMQDLEQDIRSYEQMEKEWLAQRDQTELQNQDMSEQLEMATLDKEVAEEQVELLKEQLEQEKLRADELQIDLEVLQEHQQAALDRLHEDDSSSPSGVAGDGEGAVKMADMRAAATIAQLERQNEKLKEALIRFRDVTKEADLEQRRKISSMDKELAQLNGIQAQYEQASERLESAESLIEELKEQLDDALNAEEMLEDLTERNLVLSEKVEEMKSVIEDLEALKELNDELEETHMETEKQLQEEIDLKSIALAEQYRRNETLEENVADDQAIFAQFREVTMQLQSELERLQEEKAKWYMETEGADASALAAVGGGGKLPSQTQAMLNLNMKLQTSILKSQAKTIELELGKLTAQQAQMNIDIIRPYLPAAFFNEDADAVNALLFFERIRQKADIIKNVIEMHYDIPRQLERSEATASCPPPNEMLISICQMRRHLAHFTAVSRQISAIVGHGSTGAFIRSGRMYKELLPVERRMDMYMDALRKEELKESECVSDLMRFIAQLEDFADALAGADQEAIVAGGMVIEPDAEPDLSAKEVGSVSLFEHDLDTLFASLAFTRQVITALHVDGSVEWELGGSGKSVDNTLLGPLDQLVDQLKAAKVTSHKFLRHLEGLHANTEALRMDAVSSTLPTLTQTSSELVGFAGALARSTSTYAHEVKTTKMPCLLSNFLKQVLDSTRGGFNVFDAEPWTKPLESTTSMVSTISSLLSAAKEPDNIVQLVGAEPWLARVEQIKLDSMRNVEAERTVAKLTDEIRDLYRELKWRDERLQEDGIKVERLNRQLKASREQADQIVSLKHELGETFKQSRAYQDANDALQTEIDELEKNLATARKQASAAVTASADGTANGAASVENLGQPEVSYSSIDVETSYLLDRVRALRAALQHVANENAYLKSADLRGALFSLPPLSLDEEEPRQEEDARDDQEEEILSLGEEEGEESLSTLLFRAKAVRKQALEFAATPRMLDITCTTFKPPRSHQRKHKKHGHHRSPSRPPAEHSSDDKHTSPEKEETHTPAPVAKATMESELMPRVPAQPLKRWSPASSAPAKQLAERQNATSRFSAKMQALRVQLQARASAPPPSYLHTRATIPPKIPTIVPLAPLSAA